MRNQLCAIVTGCVVLIGCKSDAYTSGLTPQQASAIDRLVSTQTAASRIPGVAIAVMENGSVAKEITLGKANVESGTPVASTTPFQLASTTKSFAAAAVLLLVGDGRLRLTDRAGDLLTDLPPAWRDVTVRQLLSHTSGLPDIVRRPGQLDLIADSWPGAFRLVENAPRQFAPGDRWAYTQTNYVLLAHIVEHLSGKSLEAFMTERIFEPLGMHHTFFPVRGDTSRTCATSYEQVNGEVTVRNLDFPPFVHAAGGLCSSLEDLVKWNVALDSGRVVKPELAKEMWSAITVNDGSTFRIDGRTIGYGLGWIVDDAPGHRSVGASGGNSTAYRRFIDERFTIIVLHNGVMDPDGLVASIASIVRSGSGGGRPDPQSALWDAAMAGDTAGIRQALDAGARIDELDTRKSGNGRRALNWAAWFNHPDAIRVLIARGATIDAENKTGFTPLHHAAEAGSEQAVEVLLAAGANRARVNRAGEQPAGTARRLGHLKIATLIEAQPAH